MKLIKTKDNSYTLYSEEYKEHYHSVSGALEEAEKKYVIPCKIKPGMAILDICFGLGYNSGMAIKKTNNIKIIALEKDKKVLEQIQNINVPDSFKKAYNIIKEAAKDFSYEDKNIKIKILLGDARKTIKQITEKFNAVFLDPFSTKKNPELWTEEFFKEIYKRMKNNSVLATYSCARVVRDNLKKAKFKIKDGPIVGRRAPSTIAIKVL